MTANLDKALCEPPINRGQLETEVAASLESKVLQHFFQC